MLSKYYVAPLIVFSQSPLPLKPQIYSPWLDLCNENRARGAGPERPTSGKMSLFWRALNGLIWIEWQWFEQKHLVVCRSIGYLGRYAKATFLPSSPPQENWICFFKKHTGGFWNPFDVNDCQMSRDDHQESVVKSRVAKVESSNRTHHCVKIELRSRLWFTFIWIQKDKVPKRTKASTDGQTDSEKGCPLIPHSTMVSSLRDL